MEFTLSLWGFVGLNVYVEFLDEWPFKNNITLYVCVYFFFLEKYQRDFEKWTDASALSCMEKK